MGDPGMVLREEDVRRIVNYVKPSLRDLVSESVPHRSHDISAQIVRVEEELKGQRELFAERFMAVDKRFADMQKQMDTRFESMDKRFGTMQWTMLFGFTIVTVAVTVFGLLA